MDNENLMLPEYEAEPRKKPLRRLYDRISSGKHSYLIYAFVLPVILNYLVYLSMGIHPFGNGSVLVLDLNGQYVYFYEALRNAVYGQTSLLYSFARSLGGEFMGIYAYYVASPFSYIVCLFPQDRVLEALLCIFLLKSGISGLTMGWYLSKLSDRINKTSVVLFSLLYAMCTYAIVQQHNSMWIDALMWLPLLTLGIEELVRNGKYRLFVSMLALSILSNFYIGYMCCIYVAAYFFYFYVSRNEDGRNNPSGEPRHFGRSLLRIGFFSALAAGIAMVIVATAAYSLGFGKNTFSNPDFSFTVRFDIVDFLTKFLIGSYDTVRPEGLPFIYCGVLTLFCLPVYFLSHKFPLREKAGAAALIGFFILSFAINPLDMIWHGFQKPNWLNYRYSFMFCFFLISLAYRGFGEIRKCSGKLIGAVGAAMVLFVAVAQKYTYHAYVERISGEIQFDQPLKTLETVWLSILFIVTIGITLGVLIRTRRRENVSLILCIIVCVELFANAIINCVEFGNDVIYSSYSSYRSFVDALRPQVNELLESDSSFYRFEKNAHRKYCDNMALNIRGITCSTSTLNKDTIAFLDDIGYASRSHWSKYLGGTPVNDSLIGIKYIIASDSDGLDRYYTKTDIAPVICNSKEYSVYENPYALSLAFAVGDGTAEFNMKSDSPMLLLNSLLTAMLDDGTEHSLFVPIEYEQSQTNLKTTATTSTYVTYKPVNTESDSSITCRFTVSGDGEVFFYLPSNYPREVRVTVNGVSKGNFYGGETTRIFSLGSFAAGTEVSLTLTLDADVLYVTPNVPLVFSLDMNEVESVFSSLAEHQYEISSWTSTSFDGTIDTDGGDTLIMTTLPYDRGWKVTVDGKSVETEQALGALISFRIEGSGTHTVTMVYKPVQFTLGLAISVLSLVLFVLIIVFEKQFRLVIDRFRRSHEADAGLSAAAADLSLPPQGAGDDKSAADGAPPEDPQPQGAVVGEGTADAAPAGGPETAAPDGTVMQEEGRGAAGPEGGS